MIEEKTKSATRNTVHRERVARLREALRETGAAGMVVPLADEHASEYVGAYAQRLRWLTGFTGSAGTAIVLADRAGFFTDGRYDLQAPLETDPAVFEVGIAPRVRPAAWLREHVAPGSGAILYDPWLHTRAWLRDTARIAGPDVRFEPVATNPIDALWTDRPAPSRDPLVVHADAYAGQRSADKRRAIAGVLRASQADAVVVTALDSIAWALNVRGSDVAFTPVARAFLLVRADASALLFVDPAKVDDAVRAHLGSEVEVVDYDAFGRTLQSLSGLRVVVDPELTVDAIYLALSRCDVVEQRDPCVLAKAIKNDVEIAGMRAAHVRDGAALTRFLHWVDSHATERRIDEIEAADRLEAFRRESGLVRGASFATISAAGPSGAFGHYNAKRGSERVLEAGNLYLVDSGAQYDDGTTDVTRTVAIGTPTPEMRARFTEALRGFVAIAMARFPAGTSGGLLDPLARQFLWQSGFDYASGTGHGVGSYLAVHEGPAFIGRRGGTRSVDEPLAAGMILSDEPGYYKPGAFGIRTENLLLVVPRDGSGAHDGWLGFESLTLAPIDRRLIDVGELSRGERRWLDDYHAQVLAALAPLVPDDVGAWLAAACAPLDDDESDSRRV